MHTMTLDPIWKRIERLAFNEFGEPPIPYMGGADQLNFAEKAKCLHFIRALGFVRGAMGTYGIGGLILKDFTGFYGPLTKM